MTLRVGILGGTFDPVHNAHLAVAGAALRQLGLGKILWLPNGAPPYRPAPVAPAAHRLAMLKLATAAEPRYEIDERELQPGASGYTYDSIVALKSENLASEFMLILGADQYAKRSTWHRWPDLEKLCAIAVVARPGSSVDAKVTTIAMTPSAVSASDIRARTGRGDDVSAMVPPAIAAYIREQGLYR